MKTKIFLAGFGLMVGPAAALAQFPNASQQVEAVQQRRQMEPLASLSAATNAAPELYAGEASDVGPQSVLQPKPHGDVFWAAADVQYFYTDNMFLTRNQRQGADVMVDTVQASVEPAPCELGGGSFAPRLGFEQQWYNFGRADHSSFLAYDPAIPGYTTAHPDTFDFNAQTILLDATWCWQKWTVCAGSDYRRLLDSGNYCQFYTEFVPRWSVQRVFDLSETTALSLGYEGACRITEVVLTTPGLDSSSNNRTDHSLVLAGSWKLCEHAVLQPYYRFEFSHYTGIHRDDYLNSFGLALYVPLCKHATVRAFVGYDNLRTDGAYVESYENLTAGGGLNLTFAF
jgi:hypothetical protein